MSIAESICYNEDSKSRGEDFLGIPGIDMECRYRKYYRVNHVPAFIVQRTPPKNREDVMEMMEAVGLDCYDAFEWLIRTPYKASQDNLIVEEENG